MVERDSRRRLFPAVPALAARAVVAKLVLVGGGGPLQVATAGLYGNRIAVNKATSRPSAEHSTTS